MGSQPTTVQPLPAEHGAALVDFARACRAAARSVSLYPATHPSIQASLSRVMSAADRLLAEGDVTLTVHPDVLAINGRAPMPPDTAVTELAGIMHARLIGVLGIERGADAHDWHALLLLLARPAEELIAEGGISKAWKAAERSHFEIGEIDYAEVLRERADGTDAQWDAIIAYCLQGATGPLDEQMLKSMLSMLGDSAKFGALITRLQSAESAGVGIASRVEALLTLIHKMLEATAAQPKAEGEAVVLQTAADASSRLTPDMMIELLQQAKVADSDNGQIASAVVDRISDETVASFVAGSVAQEGGASERLAEAFQALVPEVDGRERLLDMAKDEVAGTPFGKEASFEEMWQSAANMLTSYSDERFVSNEYARELTGARKHAIDVERVADDPPERIAAWLATLSDDALKELDLQLLLDLLQLERDPSTWNDIARLAVAQVDRRVLAGDVQAAQKLVDALVRQAGSEGREGLQSAAESALDALAAGPFARNVAAQLRKADERDDDLVPRLCHTLGARVVRPLAEVLASEQNARAVRRLRDLLIGFDAAGREAVERLKLSPNPAVRRTAVDLLRMFGGAEALGELATMLDDADPHVQREAVRAMVHIGSPEAFAILQRALAKSPARSVLTHELIGFRDARVVPLLCSVLSGPPPRGPLVELHTQVMDALGALGENPESARVLRSALYGGQWWAPARTSTLRRSAALALRRIGTATTLAILEEAARKGSRGVRQAARSQMHDLSPRERQPT